MTTPTHPLDILNGHQYMRLTTYKKSGDAVPTAVWFARAGDKLYVTTLADAGKAKRIRNNGHVEIAPCDRRGTVLGEAFSAQARLLPPEDFDAANRVIGKKYGLMKNLFDFMQRNKQRIFIEVTV